MSCESAKKLINALMMSFPEALPDKCGAFEPLKSHFDINNVDNICEMWGKTFFWKNKKYKLEGSVISSWAGHQVHGWIAIAIDSRHVDIATIVNFLKQVADIFPVDFAAIHKIRDFDIENWRSNNTLVKLNPKKDDYILSLTTHILKKGIPDLYDYTLFGKCYVDLIGSDNFFGLERASVEVFENGSRLINLNGDRDLKIINKNKKLIGEKFFRGEHSVVFPDFCISSMSAMAD
jgi:hypothetical protein